jgi:hypothetical protein
MQIQQDGPSGAQKNLQTQARDQFKHAQVQVNMLRLT